MADDKRILRARETLSTLARGMEEEYRTGRRLLSFEEYLDQFAAKPVAYGRDASRYLRDMFDHYGTRQVVRPWGTFTRYNLFDLPWEEDAALRRDALVGQEQVQMELYRVLANFAREGRPNRFILFHGPNGSAKSTLASSIMRGLEHYSTLDEGALYRFHWVFPSQKTVRGAIGFGGDDGKKLTPGGSYAHLDETQIDARLVIEIRDHPLFLIPPLERRKMLKDLFKDAGATEPPPEWLMRGQLARKNQQVVDALLVTHNGNLREVLRYVQVERYFLSHRYRTGAVTIGPQMAVDAGERQITADRSLASLPTALQATTLFEAHGELIEAAGGVLEFSDLLKRPIDAFKYLQLTVETGEVGLTAQNVQLNCVMIGSANEVHLDAFREHPEYPSFRGRFELIKAPYLLSYVDEQAIYDNQIVPQVTKPVAPHSTLVAAMFAVLSRMRRPSAERYSQALGAIVSTLTAFEKMELFATGAVPERLDADATKTLKAHIDEIYSESDVYPIYEGRIGASPREMRAVMLNAAQSSAYDYLSPLAVLDEIDELTTRKNEFAWLQEKALTGGYHDFKAMLDAIRQRLYDVWEEEIRASSGLAEDTLHGDLFDRYITHVSVWSKGEKVRNRLTGDYEDPDVNMMAEVERLLGVTDNLDDYRRGLISSIAAWAIDHPGQKIEPGVVFPQHVRKIRGAFFQERKQIVAVLARDIVRLSRDGEAALDAPRREKVKAALAQMKARFGYDENMARDAASALVRWRFADLV
jgi:predicted Ser/Thr protein kinase